MPANEQALSFALTWRLALSGSRGRAAVTTALGAMGMRSVDSTILAVQRAAIVLWITMVFAIIANVVLLVLWDHWVAIVLAIVGLPQQLWFSLYMMRRDLRKHLVPDPRATAKSVSRPLEHQEPLTKPGPLS